MPSQNSRDTDRRTLLKKFSQGAVAVPLVGTDVKADQKVGEDTQVRRATQPAQGISLLPFETTHDGDVNAHGGTVPVVGEERYTSEETSASERGTTVDIGVIVEGTGARVLTGSPMLETEWSPKAGGEYELLSEYSVRGNVLQELYGDLTDPAGTRTVLMNYICIVDLDAEGSETDGCYESGETVSYDATIPKPLKMVMDVIQFAVKAAVTTRINPVVGGAVGKILSETTSAIDENPYSAHINTRQTQKIPFIATSGHRYNIGQATIAACGGASTTRGFETKLRAETTLDKFAIRPAEGGQPSLDVTIVGTNAPVNASQFLEVTAQLENIGDASVNQEIRLIVGHDPTEVDSRSVSLGPSKTQTITLGYTTYPAKQTTTFPVRVKSEDDTAEQSVTVFGRKDDGTAFDVAIIGTNTPVDAGKFLQVTAEIKNSGTAETTQEIRLIVGHDPTEVDSQSVSLGPGETQTITLGYTTYPAKQTTTFPVRVKSEDDTAEQSVRVYGTG